MDRGGRRGNSEALARNYSDCEALLITETKAKEPGVVVRGDGGISNC